jgi:hypothetical protein
MEYNTKRKLDDGTDIFLGDKLKSPETHEVLVLLDKENNQYIVQTIDKPNVYFSLDNSFPNGLSFVKQGVYFIVIINLVANLLSKLFTKQKVFYFHFIKKCLKVYPLSIFLLL